jgi:hypothetical protein
VERERGGEGECGKCNEGRTQRAHSLNVRCAARTFNS